MSELIVTLREYEPGTDDPYIYSTWSKYSYYSPKRPVKISKDKFFKDKNAEIKEIITHGKVKVACIKDDPYVIIGYIVVKDGNLEWICVKKDYHEQGIESLLIRSMKGELNGERRSSNESDAEKDSGARDPSLEG